MSNDLVKVAVQYLSSALLVLGGVAIKVATNPLFVSLILFLVSVILIARLLIKKYCVTHEEQHRVDQN